MNGRKPLSIFAMMDSVMTRPSAVRCGKPRPVVFDTRRVGAPRVHCGRREFVLTHFLSKSIQVSRMPGQKRSTPKKRGRPVTTGKGTLVGIRCHKEFLGRVDAWRAGQEGELSRPAAIHRLAELWLDAGGRDTKRGFAD